MNDKPTIDGETSVSSEELSDEREREGARPVSPGQTGYAGSLATSSEVERVVATRAGRGSEHPAIRSVTTELLRELYPITEG